MTTKQPVLTGTDRHLQEWQFEDHQLAMQLDGVRRWMTQVAARGTPRFGELGFQLVQFRSRVVVHFEREQAIGKQLAELHEESSEAIENVSRQLSFGHRQLVGRLDELIAKLNALEPPFASWQAAMDELEAFSAAFQQHEEQCFARSR